MAIFITPVGTATLHRFGRAGRTRNKWAIFSLLAVFLLMGMEDARAQKPIRLLLLGDSLTAGYGLPRKHAFPTRLGQALKGVTIVNGGGSGDTTSGGLSRLAWLLAEKPDGVMIELGANDELRGIDPKLTRANLDNTLKILQKAGTPVLIAGMKAPPNLGREYGQAFNRIFPDLAAKYDALYYPFFLEGVAARPTLNQPDGIHPNAKGVDLIVKAILPSVRKLIERAAK